MKSQALSHSFLILEILKRIPRRRFTTSTHLHEQLEASGYELSRRTLQRWLDAIVLQYPLECDTRSKPYGYRWVDGAQGLSLPLLSSSEALLLQLARGEIAQMLPARALQSLAPLFASARQQLIQSAHPSDEGRWLKKVCRIPENLPLQASRIAPTVFESISEALYSERKLHLIYVNSRKQRKEASVFPLALAQQGNRLYLVCRFDSYDNERILALPRIANADIGEPFAYPADFDINRYLDDGHFGILRGPLVRVSFQIARAEGLHLAESPLSSDQQLEECADGFRITATLPETELLHRWLRGWGDAIKEVQIAPAEKP